MNTHTIQRKPLGILDLSLVRNNFAQALQDTLDTAQAAEKQGYGRYWVAEHHNAPSFASKATTLIMGYIAAHTSTIHVGSGGVMLPNHSPLKVAEEIATLDALYPERIELGLGRAPGTDPRTAALLRRGNAEAQNFEQDISMLQYFMREFGAGDVPFTILGSSLAGAQVAAELGMGFAVASHFAPGQAQDAVALYRQNFNKDAPTATLKEPHVTATANVAVADTTEEARLWFTSTERSFYNIAIGTRQAGLAKPTLERPGNPAVWEKIDHALKYSAYGTGKEVADKLWLIQQDLDADDMLIVNYTYDLEQCIKGNGDLAQAWSQQDK